MVTMVTIEVNKIIITVQVKKKRKLQLFLDCLFFTLVKIPLTCTVIAVATWIYQSTRTHNNNLTVIVRKRSTMLPDTVKLAEIR